METLLKFQNKQYNLKRYPKTTDASLRAWSNAELLALQYISDKNCKQYHLFNDRFGVWNCLLNEVKTVSVFTYASQQKAVFENLNNNKLSTDITIAHPLDNLKNVETALVKIPKSLALFELFLQQIHKASNNNTEVICCFMTKYFSASFLEIASKYFETVEQSLAWKKARLLILKKPKSIATYQNLINSIAYQENILQQYYGVFSADKIDIGTQFLLENITLKLHEKSILDLACGNGIIAHELLKKYPDINLTLIDDFNLAIESSKLNIKTTTTNFIWDNNLNQLKNESFDVVVSNPPFHFEHENNIDVSLALFKDVKRILKPNGRFILVANKHLNYITHLEKILNTVITIKTNKKFIIYNCIK